MIAEAKTQNYVFGYETRSYSKSYTCCQMKSVNTFYPNIYWSQDLNIMLLKYVQ